MIHFNLHIPVFSQHLPELPARGKAKFSGFVHLLAVIRLRSVTRYQLNPQMHQETHPNPKLLGRTSAVSAALGPIVPRQEFINPVDLVISTTAEGIGDPCLRIDTIELGGFNQGINDGPGFTAAF
jgi:hypothetical protein